MSIRSYIFKLFCPGALLPEQATMLKPERIEIFLENLDMSMLMTNVKLPALECNKKFVKSRAALVITGERIYISNRGTAIVDVRFDDRRFRKLIFAIPDPELATKLNVRYQVSDFMPDYHGEITITLSVTEADNLFGMLKKKQKN